MRALKHSSPSTKASNGNRVIQPPERLSLLELAANGFERPQHFSLKHFLADQTLLTDPHYDHAGHKRSGKSHLAFVNRIQVHTIHSGFGLFPGVFHGLF